MNLLKRIVPWLPIGCVAAATGLVGYAWASIAAIDNRPWASVALEAVGAMAPVLCIGGAVLLVVSSCALCKLKQAVMTEAIDGEGIIQSQPHRLPTCAKCRLREKLFDERMKSTPLPDEAASIERVNDESSCLIVFHLPEGPAICSATTVARTMTKEDGIKLLKWALPPPYNQVLDITVNGGIIIKK
jgi:hypothetical protein